MLLSCYHSDEDQQYTFAVAMDTEWRLVLFQILMVYTEQNESESIVANEVFLQLPGSEEK